MACFLLNYLKGRVADPSLPLFLTVADSLAQKDKGTAKRESVDWLFDPNPHQTVRAGNHVALRIHWGDFHFPRLGRLDLRQSTLRRRNQHRSKHNQLRYYRKLDLTQQLLQQILPLLPKGCSVYVLFDSGYTSAKLVRWARRQGWHAIAGVKCNRILSGQKLTRWHKELKGRPQRLFGKIHGDFLLY